MTNDLPFTPSQSSVTRFLKLVQDAGVPGKVDRAYLKSVGFKSGNDNYLIPIMKKIGFLSATGVPETSWRSYKDKARAPKVLANGVKLAYADLFSVYPDAYRKDEEAIRNWVGPTTGYDEVKVGHAVATFKTLCKLSEFSEAALVTPEGRPTPAAAAPEATVPVYSTTQVPPASATPGTPSININIELHLPPSADGVSYDKFFESMKKHLFPDGSSSN